MASIFITDFKFGMDRRRARIAGTPGTLWTGENVQISRGGDIERPKRFVPTYTLPSGQTFGLGGVRGQLFTFGSVASPVVPNGVQYQRLQAPSGAAMTRVLDVRSAGGKLYVIAQYVDGNIFHFYDGTRVTDWDALGDANTDFTILADYLGTLINADAAVSAVSVAATVTITARTAGTAFTIAKSTVDGGGTNDQDITLTTIQANVSPVAETRATSACTVLTGSAGSMVSDIKVNGVSILQAPVAWTTSHTVTAAAIAVQINNKTAVSGYSATAAGPSFTIRAAAGTGATPNGYAVTTTSTGSITFDLPAMSGGVSTVAGVAQIVAAALTGTFEATDRFTITINGTDYIATGRSAGTGTSAFVNKKRMFSPAGSLWEYCKLNTFNNWNDSNVSSGSGFLNVSNDTEGSERLVGAGTYISQTAVFARRNIRIYNTSTDAQEISLDQPIDNTGTVAARSITSFGTTDLFYLDETGVRSLKAREQTGFPAVNDIGVAIDPFVRSHLDSLDSFTISRACGVVEPREGRFFLALGSRIYVLNYFPGSQISAWTYFSPGFSVTDFARIYNQLYVRAGDTIYLYGGVNGTTYPNANEMTPLVELPFVSTSPPNDFMFSGFDIAATGTWKVDVIPNPNDETQIIPLATTVGETYTQASIKGTGRSACMALKLTSTVAGQATISNIALRTDGKEPAV